MSGTRQVAAEATRIEDPTYLHIRIGKLIIHLDCIMCCAYARTTTEKISQRHPRILLRDIGFSEAVPRSVGVVEVGALVSHRAAMVGKRNERFQLDLLHYAAQDSNL